MERSSLSWEQSSLFDGDTPTFEWSDLTFGWSDLTVSDLTMVQSNRRRNSDSHTIDNDAKFCAFFSKEVTRKRRN